MARTVIGTTDSITVKKYSAAMFMEAIPRSFFLKGIDKKGGGIFIGKAKKVNKTRSETSPDYPIMMLTDLEQDSGDSISYDLFMRATGAGIEGDNVLRGNEEKLVFYSDSVKIEQLRNGFDCGGKSSRKKTIHDLRDVAKSNLAGWWSERLTEDFFCYLAGDRGDDSGGVWLTPTTYTGRASNTMTAPDSTHDIYGGSATSTATITANDKFTIDLIDKALALAETTTPLMRPCLYDGVAHYVCILHSYAAYDLWTNTATGQWMEIVKSAEKRGSENPIFKGGDVIGMYKNVILMKHPKIPRNTDWGSGAIAGARNLFLGAQAGVIAWGSPGDGLRFDWHEEMEDRGNVQIIDSGSMYGVKKCIFNSLDNGVITINTAAANPNA